jgi:nondiscriminating aspartyl-tRNA synthetase
MQTIQWKKEVSEEIFRGLVIRARELGPIGFIHLKTDRGLIQIVLPKNIELPSIGCAVEVKGEVVPAKIKDPSLHFRQSEVQAVSMTILSAPSEVLPFEISKPELNINNDLLMDHRSLSLKHPKQTAIFVIKHWLLQGMREFLVEEGFIEIHTPKIVAEGAEGGANIFSLDYFGRKAYLAQSPQFYKEFCAGAFLKVFEVAPVFRAEKHNTSRHMNEYTSFDIEFGPLRSFEEIMALEVGMLKAGLAKLAKHAETELNLLKAKLPVV